MSKNCKCCDVVLGKYCSDGCELIGLREQIPDLERKLKDLQKAMCIYAREELGNMCFETDQEVIEYFLDYAKEAE